MTGIVLTQSGTFIIGDIARILGWIMNVLFNFLDQVFGIQNIGLCIILFTIIIYLLMLPLTIKQQKFSKFSAKMNPELKAIQKKYANKKDEMSMLAMNEETKAVYAKYGVSPTGSCLQLLIQMPILFALYQVIMRVPAYVDGVKNVFTELATEIMNTAGGVEFMQELSQNGAMTAYIGKDFTQTNTVIDILYRLQETGKATWMMLADQFPSMDALIESTHASISHLNDFILINIANSPMNMIKSGLSTGQYLMVFGAILVPVLAALTQWLNVAMMPQQTSNDPNDTMASTMKSMNIMMPLMSAWFCLSLPAGMGLYWIMGAVVRGIQQFLINKHLDKMDIDAIVKKNIEKNEKLREKKGLPPQKDVNLAKTNMRAYDSEKKKNHMTEEEKKAAMEIATNYYKNADKPGSLASKADMVRKFNEKSKK
ncbi:membrane protein insertase YidC [Clostridiaceae bacterium OM08-6BH]|nr:membrane protein insertase YidC [Clostridiaceae bacterium OM08-6BH]